MSRFSEIFTDMGTNPFGPTPQNGQTNCLGVFDHFVGLVLKGLMSIYVMGIFYTISPFPASGLFLYALKFRKLGMK